MYKQFPSTRIDAAHQREPPEAECHKAILKQNEKVHTVAWGVLNNGRSKCNRTNAIFDIAQGPLFVSLANRKLFH